MSKKLLSISVFFLFCSLSLAETNKEISFVASKKELSKAENADNLRGIAISIKFYRNAPADIQKRVDVLVSNLISLKFHPVFLYGQPFEPELAKRLLITNSSFDGSNCQPTAWAGILPKDNDVGTMCGADDKPRNEKKFRRWITEFWNNAKKRFLENK